MDKPIYASILDAILGGDDPDFAEAGLTEAKSSGDALLDLGHDEVDPDVVPSATRAAAAKKQRNEGKTTTMSSIIAHRDDWRGKAAKTVGDDNILTDVVESMNAAKGTTYEQKTLSDAEVFGYIDKLLNAGIEPKKVAAKLDKLAELNSFNRSLSQDYLNQNAGVMGIAYLNPNEFNRGDSSKKRTASSEGDSKDCVRQLKSWKAAGIKPRAASVKKITACEGCSYNKNASCNLYGLPLIASEKQLLPIINNLTGGSKNPKQALLSLANREGERVTATVKSEAISRVTEKTRVASVESLQLKKEAAPRFDADEVMKMHVAGQGIQKIFDFGVKKAGQVVATKAVRDFVAGLKRSGAKVALTQIDCSLLKGKLGSSNAIIGDHRCASCTYRRGMSCGLTGGTLAAFPDMDKMASNHKIAAGAPKDGRQMMKDFDMMQQTPFAQNDIEYLDPVNDDVEPGGKLNID